MVGGRTIRATLPGVELDELEPLPGVTHAERHGDAVLLSLRRLRRGDPRAAGQPSPRHATSRSRAPGSNRPSSN